MHHVRRGSGSPLLLLPGLGGSWRSWSPVLDGLAAHREVIAVDLPGFGLTPPLDGEVSVATLTDAVALPRQAERATALFPDARLHWFARCGHFPQFDAPAETVELVLRSTG